MARGFKTGGRRLGSVNRTTARTRAALEACFEQLGGVDALVEWAQQPENRGEFYKLWAKLLPHEPPGTAPPAVRVIFGGRFQPAPRAGDRPAPAATLTPVN